MRALELKGWKGVRCLKLLRNVPSIDWNYFSTSQFEGSPLWWSLCTENKCRRVTRFLLSLPEVQVDIRELRDKDRYDKAMDVCKLYVTKKMKKYKVSEEDTRKKSIFDFLLFALQKDLSSNIVALLLSALTTLDVVELVIYKYNAAKDDERNLSSKAADDSEEEHSFFYKVMKKLQKQSNDDRGNMLQRVNGD